MLVQAAAIAGAAAAISSLPPAPPARPAAAEPPADASLWTGGKLGPNARPYSPDFDRVAESARAVLGVLHGNTSARADDADGAATDRAPKKILADKKKAKKAKKAKAPKDSKRATVVL